MHSLTIW